MHFGCRGFGKRRQNGLFGSLETSVAVCPVIMIERVELFTGKLVLQLQGMVVGDVCELVERVRVVYMGYWSARYVRVDDGTEV